MGQVEMQVRANRLKVVLAKELGVKINDAMARNIEAQLEGFASWDQASVGFKKPTNLQDPLRVRVEADMRLANVFPNTLESIFQRWTRARAQITNCMAPNSREGALIVACGNSQFAQNTLKVIAQDACDQAKAAGQRINVIRMGVCKGDFSSAKSVVDITQRDQIPERLYLEFHVESHLMLLGEIEEYAGFQAAVALATRGHKVLCSFANSSEQATHATIVEAVKLTNLVPFEINENSLNHLIERNRMMIIKHALTVAN
jgi:hypothetical protein